MSVVRCESCDRLIDSDIDCECFVEPPDYLPLTQAQRDAMTETLCESCRENRWEREQERMHGGCQP